MSYAMLKSTPFLKVGDKYLMLRKIASSNVRPIDYEICLQDRIICSSPYRECKNIVSKFLHTKEEIMGLVDAIPNILISDYRNGEYGSYDGDLSQTSDTEILNSFGFLRGISVGGTSTHTTTYNKYRNLYLYGIRNAIDVETVKDVYSNELNFKIELIKWNDKKGGFDEIHTSPYCNTVEELTNVLNEFEKLYNNLNGDVYYIRINYGCSFEMQPKVRKIKSGKTLVNGDYVITVNNGIEKYYLHNKNRNVINTHYDKKYAKKFVTEKAALKWLEKSNLKLHFPAYFFKVVNIENILAV